MNGHMKLFMNGENLSEGELPQQLSLEIRPKWDEFVKTYNIKRQMLRAFHQRLRELALESDGLFADVKFLMDGDSAASGHKILFQSNSNFFEAILGNGMAESELSEIPLRDLVSER